MNNPSNVNLSKRITNSRIAIRIGASMLFAVAFLIASTHASAGSRTVKVLYAGSLTHVMQRKIRPAFEHATGDQFVGYSAGSNKLANEITGHVRRGDVFISANPSVNNKLLGHDNGDWARWYATFMTSPLVIGINPHSHLAQALHSKPWYQVLTRPGIKIGRTDPKLDPKGQLIVKAFRRIARKTQQPDLRHQLLAHSKVYPEQDLIGRLQSGQIDVGFFYKGEAVAANIPSVSIKPVSLAARYTVTVLHNAPDAKGASDFVRFLLSAKGAAILKRNGFNVRSQPTIKGNAKAIPHALQPVLGQK